MRDTKRDSRPRDLAGATQLNRSNNGAARSRLRPFADSGETQLHQRCAGFPLITFSRCGCGRERVQDVHRLATPWRDAIERRHG